MKIGLRVNKGNKEFVRVCDAVLEIGILGGQIASALTTHEPAMSIHHSNFVLEGNEEMNKCEVIGILDEEGYEKENRVYNGGGLCPTLLVGNGRVKALVEDKIKKDKEKTIIKVGQISSEGSEYGTVISENGISSTLAAGTHGYAATKEGSIKCKVGGCYDASYPDSKTRRGRVQEGGDVTPTITTQGGENINYVETVYRIRKLTPKECWRLMGYNDVDFDKVSSVNSNTQLYKQAGNAIVKQVLMAIFSQLNIKGVKAWNDMTETEKRAMIKKTTMAGE